MSDEGVMSGGIAVEEAWGARSVEGVVRVRDTEV